MVPAGKLAPCPKSPSTILRRAARYIEWQHGPDPWCLGNFALYFPFRPDAGQHAAPSSGDRDALRRVYDATSAKLFAVCLHIVGDQSAAEDALQNAYIKVWQRSSSFDPARASAMTWLLLVTRGVAIDALRASGRATRNSERHHVQTSAARVQGDLRSAIDECLELLEDASRTAVLDAFFGGYTYDELARREATPLGTMKSRIRRALSRLRMCLDDA